MQESIRAYPDRSVSDHGYRACIALPWIEALGPDRSMFGSDYPVSACCQSFAGICNAMRRIVARWPAAAQRAIFHDTADRIYRSGADNQPVPGR